MLGRRPSQPRPARDLLCIPVRRKERKRHDGHIASHALHVLQVPERIGVIVPRDEEDRVPRAAGQERARKVAGCRRLRTMSAVFRGPVGDERKIATPSAIHAGQRRARANDSAP
jgi:hypothetical protein